MNINKISALFLASARLGFSTATLYFDPSQRFALDGIFALTNRPLQIWAYLGALFSLGGFGYAISGVLHTLWYGIAAPAYASLIVSVLFWSGIPLISLGLIGEYVGRTSKAAKGRLSYIAQDTHGV